MGKVIRMNRSVCGPVLQLFQRPARILEDLAIDGFDLTIRGQHPNQTGYPVDCRAQTSLAFTQCLLCPLAIGQIEHERNSLVAAFFEQRAADKHRNAAAVLAKILLLERLKAPGRAQFRQGALVVLAPFRRRQSGPAHIARNQVFTVIPYDTEKRVIGLKNSTFEIGNEDANNVGVDQTPNLPFAICQIEKEPRILERNRGLRGEHLQHRDALGRENARSQIVLKIENADEISLVYQWQTENGPGATPNDVGIGRKRVLR